MTKEAKNVEAPAPAPQSKVGRAFEAAIKALDVAVDGMKKEQYLDVLERLQIDLEGRMEAVEAEIIEDDEEDTTDE